MSLDNLLNRLPEFAKDTRLNLSSLLTREAVDDLNAVQIAGVALACAYTTQQSSLIQAIQTYSEPLLDDATQEGVKIAASLMAMNNVYYRFIHMVSDASFKTLPAKLRMNKMAQPGVAPIDFELYALAVSAINACQLCIDSHVGALKKHGVSLLAIQTAVRIAAVMQATAQSLVIVDF